MTPTPESRLQSVVPEPLQVLKGDGSVVLPDPLPITVAGASSAGLVRVIRAAQAILPMPVLQTESADFAIRVSIASNAGEPAEAYQLTVDTAGASVSASHEAGVINALHTLRQLLPPDAYRSRPADAVRWDLPMCTIVDAPRFAWRGVLIDVARHFLPKQELLKHITVLASYKINRIQLHLTDCQGWRIDLPDFPRLRQVGAWRERTQRSHFDDPEIRYEEAPHGGCYSLEDLREMADLASDLGAELVLEIELPGHTGALLAAYPELGSPFDPEREVAGRWGVLPNLVSPLGAALDTVEEMLDSILSAVPGSYLHMGADESLIDEWRSDPAIASAAEAADADPSELFERVVSRVERLASERGRSLLTWDEAFAVAGPDAAVGKERIVVAWRGVEVARRAAASGRRVILAPIFPTYFDYAQSDSGDEPLAIGSALALNDVLSWDPVPPSWTEAERDHVLGIQGQLWTEFVPDGRAVDYMLYPRAVALADVAWRSAPSFGERRDQAIALQLARLAAAGVEYRPLTGPEPWQKPGTAWRRPYATPPMRVMAEIHEQAALEGRIPTEEDYSRAARRWVTGET